MGAIGAIEFKHPGHLLWARVGGTAAARGVTPQQLTNQGGDGLFNYLEETKRERKTVSELFVRRAMTGTAFK